MGLGSGAVLGGLLPDVLGQTAERLGFSIYDVSYAASFAVMLGVLAFTKLVIVENPHPRDLTTLAQGFLDVPRVTKEASLFALKHPTLSRLLASLALQGSIIGFVSVFILYSVILGVSETPASSILHRCVQDRQRSTMLLLKSLIQQLGAALGLVLAGAASIVQVDVARIGGITPWMKAAKLSK